MPTICIAHRGGAALYPENTLAAFRNAIALGCDGAELDVQLSADGVVVVYHNARLNPGYTRKDGAWLDGSTPCIKDLTLAQLRVYDVGRARPGSDYARAHPGMAAVDGERIPTLEEVVSLAKSVPDFQLWVELKCDDGADSADPVMLADATLKVIEDAGFLTRTVFVGFDWRALARTKQAKPTAEIWCTTTDDIESSEPLLQTIRAMGGAGWFPHHSRLTDQAALLARSHGLKLAAWTVNEASEMRRLRQLGVEAICTDRPDLL